MKSLSRTGRAVTTLALAMCSVIASAAAPDGAEAVRATLHARFPDLKIQDVRASTLPGWYEVFTGSQLVYSDETADHLFVGKLIDTHTKKDLAAEQLENRLVIDFDKLPFDRAIKIVKDNGSRRLALFEDPDCPFCQQFEHELANVNDVTLYCFPWRSCTRRRASTLIPSGAREIAVTPGRTGCSSTRIPARRNARTIRSTDCRRWAPL